MSEEEEKKEAAPPPKAESEEKNAIDALDAHSEDGDEEDEGPPPIDFAALGRDLVEAAKRGDAGGVEDLVGQGAPVTMVDENDWSALTWASCRGDKKLVDLLLENGAGAEYKELCAEHEAAAPSTRNRAHQPMMLNSPLHWAAYKGHAANAAVLLIHGFNPSDVDRDGNTCWHLAAAGGDLETFKLFCMQGLDLSSRNTLGNTVLDMASTPTVAALARRAAGQQACDSCGSPFAEGQQRFLCSTTKAFLHEHCSAQEVVVVDADTEEARPLRYSRHITMRIRDQEGELGAALDELSNAVAADTTQLDRVIASASNLGASAIALREARQRKQTLDAERHLKDEVKNLRNARPPTRRQEADAVIKAMESVRAHGGSENLVSEAATLVQVAFEEIKLGSAFTALKGLGSDVDPAHKVVEATSAAAAVVHKLDASSPLADEAKSYVAALSARATLAEAIKEHEVVWDKEAEEPTIKVVRMPDGTEHPSVLVPLRLRVARLQYALDTCEEAGVEDDEEGTQEAARGRLEALSRELKKAEAAEAERAAIEAEEAANKAAKKGKKK